ncbi:hypothetical protein N7448_007239 [Penicillium atrosanguineum]|uniref:uncharacterized protein n=1 Tax=Penicillium atrosanguineum TaxID=1132637 RepID=UPI0023A50185|nr:uncharacterized protein N7443_001734 [Penicillium atrosanguineum]KAJ5126460.1 hypothetical protein N7448_007239 [Penicillium atrosanguineum]KAJ5146660.1 hypothetical protein N7526_000012 [Penicillium atrosanguineum]KAJ5314850.1 hypothetical protein N7443_001734 [Penicillium atrosanguineum]
MPDRFQPLTNIRTPSGPPAGGTYTDMSSVGDGVGSSTAVMSGDASSICLCGKVILFAQVTLWYGLILPDGRCRCEGHSGVQLACEWEHTMPFTRKRIAVTGHSGG